MYNEIEIRVDTLQSLLNAVSSQINEYIKSNWRANCKVFFRGQANMEWKLESSIMRQYEINGHEEYHNNSLVERCTQDDSPLGPLYIFESDMLHDVKKYFPNELGGLSQLQILSKLQHHGLPTRLLDVSHNYLVAAYFASNESSEKDKDGVIYAFYGDAYRQDDEFVAQSVEWSFSRKDGTPRVPSFIIDADYNHIRLRNQQGAFIWESCSSDTEKLLIPIKLIIPSEKRYPCWHN